MHIHDGILAFCYIPERASKSLDMVQSELCQVSLLTILLQDCCEHGALEVQAGEVSDSAVFHLENGLRHSTSEWGCFWTSLELSVWAAPP